MIQSGDNFSSNNGDSSFSI